MSSGESLEPRLVLSASTLQAGVTSFQWQGVEHDVVADQWIVRLADPAVDLTSLAQGLSSSHGIAGAGIRRIGSSRFGVLSAPLSDAADILSWAGQNPLVKYVEPNFVVSTAVTTPNDLNSNLWGLNNTGQTGGTAGVDIDAPEAWDTITGSASVVVGIIDTGIDYNHPDLSGNMWKNPVEFGGTAGVDDDGNGYIDDIYGWDFANGDSDPFDDHFHGTHVAGTVGGQGNNNTGVVGVNWDVELMALKFLGSNGSGAISDAVEAVAYATDLKRNHGINVVATNNSWGGGGFSQAMLDAINDANTEDILFIAAAGNSSSNNDAVSNYPSNYNAPNVIAVAATDHNDNLASFSSYGLTTVDLGAPGVNTYSTFPGNSYGSLSGTSMASPHVAGVAALVAAADPSATAAQIKTAILDGTVPTPAMNGITVSGGRLNAFFAVNFTAPTILSGELWHDLNGDGTRDPGDPGIKGQTIYDDANNNSVVDGGEIVTKTNATGGYTFTDVTPGTHRLRTVVPPTWQNTAPSGDGSHFLTVVDGDQTSNLDFGLHLPGFGATIPYSENFQDNYADYWTEVGGAWSTEDGRYTGGEADLTGVDSYALLMSGDSLPSQFKYSATIRTDSTGQYQNSMLIFDFQSTSNYKFAMLETAADKIRLGSWGISGPTYHTDLTVPSLTTNKDYQLLIEINGLNATLTLDGGAAMSNYTYGDSLNDGALGLGTSEGFVHFDNVIIGDMNGDRLINTGDAAPLVQALVNRGNYDTAYPDLDADVIGDMNGSGTFDLGDIRAFPSLFQPTILAETIGDSSVRESAPNTPNNGSGIKVWNSNSTDSQRRWGIVAFDVTKMIIEDVELRLWADQEGLSDEPFPLNQSAAIINAASVGKPVGAMTWNDVSGLTQTPLETLGTYDSGAPDIDPLLRGSFLTSKASSNDVAAIQAVADGEGQLFILMMADEDPTDNYSGTWGDDELFGRDPILLVNGVETTTKVKLTATGDTWVRESHPTTAYDADGMSVWNSNSNDGSRRWGIVEFDVDPMLIETAQLKLWSDETGFSDDIEPLKQTAAIIDISSVGKPVSQLTWSDVIGLTQTPLEALGTYDIDGPAIDLGLQGVFLSSTATTADLTSLQTVADGSGQLVILMMADEDPTENYSGTWGDEELYGFNAELVLRGQLTSVTTEVQATEDTWVRESNVGGTFDNDGISVWNSNSNDGQRRWGIVEFDVSQFSGQTIDELALDLYSFETGFSDDAVPLKQSAAIIDISSTGKATQNLSWSDVSGLAQTALETLGKYDIPAPDSDVDEYKTSLASANDLNAVQSVADGSGQLVLLLMADEDPTLNYSGTWADVEASFGGQTPRLQVTTSTPASGSASSASAPEATAAVNLETPSSDTEPAPVTNHVAPVVTEVHSGALLVVPSSPVTRADTNNENATTVARVDELLVRNQLLLSFAGHALWIGAGDPLAELLGQQGDEIADNASAWDEALLEVLEDELALVG